MKCRRVTKSNVKLKQLEFLDKKKKTGSERPLPGRAPLHASRSPSRAPAAILSPGTPRADVAGVARSWRRGGSGGARDSQLFFGYVM